jgi:hypothetical protein
VRFSRGRYFVRGLSCGVDPAGPARTGAPCFRPRSALLRPVTTNYIWENNVSPFPAQLLAELSHEEEPTKVCW